MCLYTSCLHHFISVTSPVRFFPLLISVHDEGEKTKHVQSMYTEVKKNYLEHNTMTRHDKTSSHLIRKDTVSV